LWGNPIDGLVKHLHDPSAGFDLLILADVLFNHSEHSKLVATVTMALKKAKHAKALVVFTPYRPWLLEKDLAFFDLAHDAGLHVEMLFEKVMEQVMFDEDPGVSRCSVSLLPRLDSHARACRTRCCEGQSMAIILVGNR
jgi:nicotinamide N-methyltransferase